jgi:hypothetical protein
MILRALRASAVGSEEPRGRGERGDQRQRVPGSANRVNRGGGFNDLAVNARSANRNHDTPSNADDNLGLRPAKALLMA